VNRLYALTLWPEWIWAIAHLGKDVENRSWRPPPAFVGRQVALHAGMTIGGRDLDEASALRLVVEMAELAGWRRACHALVRDDVRRGRVEVPLPSASCPPTRCAVVAVATLGEPTRTSCSPWAVPGRWHWPLLEVRVLPRPVRVRGRQGLWALADADVSEVLGQVRGAA